MTARRPTVPLILAALAVGLAASLLDRPAAAQRPPANDPVVMQALLRRYGTRQVVTTLAVPGAGRAQAAIRVANAGWEPTHVVAVGFGAPPAAPGCDAAPPQIVAVACLPRLAPLASADLPALPGADRALIYSVGGDGDAICAHADALRSGAMALAAFETTVWAAEPGAPVAAAARIAAAGGETGRAGVPATGLAGLGLLRPGAPQPAVAGYVPRAAAVRMVNLGAECARIDVRAGRLADSGPCQLPQTSSVAIAPGQAFDLEPAGNAPVVGLAARGEVASSVAWSGPEGAASYDGQAQGAEGSGTLAFPVAVAPLTNPRAELWVTNQAPTATTQIALLMWDGNLAQHRIFNDPDPLCPGTTRRYDIAALAGTIPPTRGRAGTEGPPSLSLRVESLNPDVPTAPPIAGVMVVGGDEGIEAYSGIASPQELALANRYLRQLQGQPGMGTSYAPTNAVADVVVRHGPERRTTFLAIQAMGVGGAAERSAVIDLYDASGALVLAGTRVQLGAGPGAIVDIGRLAGRAMDRPIADGFVGTALVRGEQARGALGVLAFTRPTGPDIAAPGGADRLTLAVAPPLLRGPDPNAPTPTPIPTRPTREPTPEGSPTPDDEPTPTSRPPAVPAARIALPWGHRP